MMYKGYIDKEGTSISYPICGMFMSPDNNGWSSKPYTKEQKKQYKKYLMLEKAVDKIIAHIKRTDRTLLQEFELVKANKSTLPAYCRRVLYEAFNQ